MQTMALPRRPAPRGVWIEQALPHVQVSNVRGETRQRLLDAGLAQKVHKGARIAITAGSRGMGCIVELLQGVVDAVKAVGGEPFLIPAMGSHGGATPEGQVEILRRLNITEESIGAPIQATMETVPLGQAKSGAQAHLDKFAAEADGIIVLGRVKTHPESAGPIAAGLMKMTTIGLGKQAGAQEAHSHGLWESVPTVPQITLQKAKVLFGVAVVENGYRHPAAVEVVPGVYDAFHEVDSGLLNKAKELMGLIPFGKLDVLVVDEIGKNIAGTCMDPNVVGKWRAKGKGPEIPNYRRIVALSLTHPSLGNGLGVGMADFTTERFLKEYDPDVTAVNLLTATEPGSWNPQEACVPFALPTDREAVEVALYSALAAEQPRVCRIKNTDELSRLWVSESLLEEVTQNPRLAIQGTPAPMEFNAQGNLF